MITGVYKITCIPNNRIYIGSAKNIKIRWNRHINDLNLDKHINIYMQRSFNKYGIDNFKFEIVEKCDTNILLIREQYYLDLYKPYINGFNIGISSSGGDNLSYNPNKKEICDKISKSLILTFSNMTKEEKIIKFSKPMEKNPNWQNGKSKIVYYCECGRTKKQNTNKCIKCFDKSGDKNPFFGKKHSKESIEKMSKSALTRGYKGSQNTPVIINEIEYSSLGKASNQLNIPITTIRWRILSKNKKYKEYKYKSI